MRSKRYLPQLLLTTCLYPSLASASEWFAGYEFGEMAFNDFQNIAGEIGYAFDNGQSIRFSYLNIALSERHLSSDEARGVDGDNVEGLWRGLDVYYDFPITKSVYISPSLGYHDTEFSHTVLNESVRNKSAIAGFALGYLGEDIFGIKQLYWRFTLTVNYQFSALVETELGESVVKKSEYGFIPQIFIGYGFK